LSILERSQRSGGRHIVIFTLISTYFSRASTASDLAQTPFMSLVAVPLQIAVRVSYLLASAAASRSRRGDLGLDRDHLISGPRRALGRRLLSGRAGRSRAELGHAGTTLAFVARGRDSFGSPLGISVVAIRGDRPTSHQGRVTVFPAVGVVHMLVRSPEIRGCCASVSLFVAGCEARQSSPPLFDLPPMPAFEPNCSPSQEGKTHYQDGKHENPSPVTLDPSMTVSIP